MNTDISFIEKKIENTIIKNSMLKDVKTVIIGVSGGADSMTLLSFFEKNAKKFNLKIIAAHVNHGLRGEEAKRDEDFVRDYCNKNNIKIEILSLDVKKIAKESKKGIEECARKLRYEFFNDLAKKYDGKIATAHTLSDSVETMLINLTRGTGSAGLIGIPAKRENIIRPLIELKRIETQKYCKKNKINYVVDSTNLNKDYTRNKIRLEIIPILKKINPNFETAANRAMSFLKLDDDYLNNVAKKKLEKSRSSKGKYDLKDIKEEPRAILTRIIRLAIFEFLKTNVTSHHIELILMLIKNNTGAVVLPKGIKVLIENEVLTLEKIKKEKQKKSNIPEVPFRGNTVLTGNEEKFIIKVLNKSEFDKVDKLEFFYVMDYDKIGMDSKFRTRKAGDKFCKSGRGVTKSVKKLFNELKISQNKRDEVLMLANESQVLWINNVGISEFVKIDEKTKNFALIYCKKNMVTK